MTDADNNVIAHRPLHGMFTTVPRHYDLVNNVITWSLDERWRKKAARECLASNPEKVLDLCCGTGDLAIYLARLSQNNIELTGLDYSQPMLDIANLKAQKDGVDNRISFIYGDAASLPFPDEHFDSVGISFAFRNLTYKNPMVKQYVAEVVRILKPGGRFVIVESSQPKSKLIRKLFHLYLRWFAFGVGYLISGNKGAYHYLAESASRFYTPEEIEELLLTAGFRQVLYQPILFGAIGTHIALK